MSISIVSSVYRVNETGSGQNRHGQPRQGQSDAHGGQEADNAPARTAHARAAGGRDGSHGGDLSIDVSIGKTVDVMA